MKKILLTGICLSMLCGYATAQNRKIDFETGTWQQALQKARLENKMLFVDCYTTWCGPCKMLDRDVFTVDSVADFYNKHFVNFKYDKESDPALEIENPYGIPAVPTLLYVDTKGVVRHLMVGAYPDLIISEARIAMDNINNLDALIRRYDAGERSTGFMRQYVAALAVGYQPDRNTVLDEYLSLLSDEEFFTADTWSMINKHVKDLLNPHWQKAISSWLKFSPRLTIQEVERKIESGALGGNSVYHHWKPGEPFDEKHCLEVIDILRTLPYERAGAMIAEMYVVRAQYYEDYAQMLAVLKNATYYNVWGRYLTSYLAGCFGRLSECRDEKVLREASHWLRQLLEQPYSEYIQEKLKELSDELDSHCVSGTI